MESLFIQLSDEVEISGDDWICGPGSQEHTYWTKPT